MYRHTVTAYDARREPPGHGPRLGDPVGLRLRQRGRVPGCPGRGGLRARRQRRVRVELLDVRPGFSRGQRQVQPVDGTPTQLPVPDRHRRLADRPGHRRGRSTQVRGRDPRRREGAGHQLVHLRHDHRGHRDRRGPADHRHRPLPAWDCRLPGLQDRIRAIMGGTEIAVVDIDVRPRSPRRYGVGRGPDTW